VDRRRLALTKVFAGWVWLMAALAVFVVWLLSLALLAHAAPVQIVMRVPFAATTAMYLLGSALVLASRHPLRWLLGAVGVYVLLATLTEALGRTETGEWQIFVWSDVLRWAIYGPYGIDTFLSSKGFSSAAGDAAARWQTLPDLARWTISTFLWFGAGLAALWAAASRHRERRRH
jgi:hypothetical protein